MTGGRATRAYLFEAGNESCAFIQSPCVRGVWLRVLPAVVLADCDDCGAKVHEQCKVSGGRVLNGVHASRKKKADAGERPRTLVVVATGGRRW